MNSRRSAIKTKRTSNTCEWILTHRNFQAWNRDGPGVLWIKGYPGSGKSTLIEYLLTLVEQTQATKDVGLKVHTLSFFLHRRGTQLEQSFVGTLRSLLYQILSKNHRLLDLALEQSSMRRPTRNQLGGEMSGTWSEGELKLAFTAAITELSTQAPVCLFVDALDEAGESVAVDMIEYFSALREPANQRLKICFSCRYYPIISIPSHLDIQVERDNQGDMAKCLQRSFTQHGFALDLQARLTQVLISKANGNFLWVSLTSRRACDLHRRGKGPQAIFADIEKLPPDLNGFYRSLLQAASAEDVQQRVKLFQWLLFAQRPLCVREVRMALCLGQASSATSMTELERQDDFVSCSCYDQESSPAVDGRERKNDSTSPVAVEPESTRGHLLANRSAAPGKSGDGAVADASFGEAPLSTDHGSPQTATQAGAFRDQRLQCICGARQQTQQRVTDLSCGLIDFTSSGSGELTAQLIHQTVKDFMLDFGLRLILPPTTLSLDSIAHRQLSRSLTQFVLFPEVSCSQPWELEPKAIERANPFLFYALEYWHLHTHHGWASGSSDEKLPSILDDSDSPKLQYFMRKCHSLRYMGFTLPTPIAKVRAIHILAYLGLEEALKQLLAKTPSTIRLRDGAGNTALHWAVMGAYGSTSITRLLRSKGLRLDAENENGWSPLECSLSRYGHSVGMYQDRLAALAKMTSALRKSLLRNMVAMLGDCLDEHLQRVLQQKPIFAFLSIRVLAMNWHRLGSFDECETLFRALAQAGANQDLPAYGMDPKDLLSAVFFAKHDLKLEAGPTKPVRAEARAGTELADGLGLQNAARLSPVRPKRRDAHHSSRVSLSRFLPWR